MMKTKACFALAGLGLGTVILGALAVGYSRTSHLAAGHSSATEPLKEIDWEHVGEYRRWLESSTDPRAVAFRRAIAHGPEELAKAKALARKAGMRLALEELQPAVPSSDNAAALYLQLQPIATVDKAASWTLETLNPLASYPPGTLDAARKELMRNQASLKLLHRAGAMHHYVPTRGPTQQVVPGNVDTGAAARELAAESYVRYWSDGKFQEAINDVKLEFRLSAQTEEAQPDLLGYLRAMAIVSIPVQTLRDYLYLVGPNKSVAEQVRLTLERDWPRLNIQTAVEGDVLSEFHLVDSTFGKLLSGASNGDAQRWPAAQNGQKPLAAADREFVRNLLDLIKANILSSRLTVYIAAEQPFPGVISAMERAGNVKNPETMPGDLGVFVDVSAMGNVGFISARRKAERDVVLLGAAALDYQARNAKLPTRLDVAMPDAPKSPFDGKQYLYQKTNDGFLVSVVPPGQPVPGTPKDFAGVLPIEFRYPAPAELRKAPESYADYMRRSHGPASPEK